MQRKSPFPSLVFLAAVLACLAMLSGCGAAKKLGLAGADERPPVATGPVTPERPRNPWDTWRPGETLNGKPLNDKAIRHADELYQKGDMRGALREYQSAARRKLSGEDREALFVRIAGTQLGIGETEKSMSTASGFYGGNQGAVDRVNPQFSIILGYGYARTGNLQQGLAWFSQAAKRSAGNRDLEEAARAGVRDVLTQASDADIDSLDATWSQNALVGPVLGEVRKMRSRGMSPGRSFEVQVAPAPGDESAITPRVTHGIGVLVPLSGEHARLGKATLNGIAFALNDLVQNGSVQLVEKDTADAATGSIEEAVNALAANGGAELILGPLIGANAPVAAETARLRGLPLITFSKQSSFQAGGGVYRFGPTARSQMISLVETAAGLAGLKRFAMVYPANAVGAEFADEFRKAVKANGAELVLDREYQPGSEQELMTLAEEVVQADPDAVFCPDSIPAAASFFVNIPEPARTRISPLGTASWDDSKQLKQVTKAMEGAIFPSIFFMQSSNPSVRQFVEAYRGKYGEAPDFLAAQGFDAGALVSAALKEVSPDRSFQSAIQSIGSYEGITGRVSVESSGEIERFYRVVVFTKGTETEMSQNEDVIRELKRRKELFKSAEGTADGTVPFYRAQ